MMQGGDSIQSYKAVDIWIFGYKLHLVSSTGSLIVPLSEDFTQADDVQDNQIYSAITCSSSLPQGVRYMAAADSGYYDHNLYNLSIDRRGFDTSSDRLQLIEFYESELGQAIHSGRSTFIDINRTYQRCLQNRSFTNKRISESSWTSTAISTDLSNHCLLQL